jgi:16S rRNA (guanine(1405)-N(7))-methyltransferase
MNERDPLLQEVVSTVLSKPKYSAILPGLAVQIAGRELAKGRKPREAIKEVSAKLHQVGAAYFKLAPHYDQWKVELENLPGDPADKGVRAFCLKVMQAHSSTAERLPILEDFFKETLASLAPLESLADLACGLNPLALPWMPLARGARYGGCDIFSDLIDFDNAFLTHYGLQAGLTSADVFSYKMQKPVQLALLLKSLPCLEQLEKGRGQALLESIPAAFILASYPIRSLGGKSKGMRQTYAAQFEALTDGKKWKVTRFDFPSELAYLVEK